MKKQILTCTVLKIAVETEQMLMTNISLNLMRNYANINMHTYKQTKPFNSKSLHIKPKKQIDDGKLIVSGSETQAKVFINIILYKGLRIYVEHQWN